MTIQAETIFLAKGEQKSIQIKGLHRFSIGNKEVLGHQFIKVEDTLHIKGKAVGYSDLIVWTQADKKQTFHFYILSKGQYLKTIQWSEYLQGLGLNTEIKGNMLNLSGEITNLNSYQSFHRAIEKIGKENIYLNIKISKQLKNEIIAQIIRDFIKTGDQHIDCGFNEVFLRCFHTGEQISLIKHFKKLYFTEFIKVDPILKNRNLKISMQLFQVEYSSKEIVELGLSKIHTQMENVLKNKMNGLIQDNIIQLANSKAQITTVASPEAITQIGKELELSLGAEVPFIQQASLAQQTTEWKFSGIKLKMNIDKLANNYLLNYQTEFTSPQSQGIDGARERGSVKMILNYPVKIFRIGHSIKQVQIERFPILSKIPILGNIFKSDGEYSSYREIYGLIKMEEQ